jgi:hypothetical protein
VYQAAEAEMSGWRSYGLPRRRVGLTCSTDTPPWLTANLISGKIFAFTFPEPIRTFYSTADRGLGTRLRRGLSMLSMAPKRRP